MDAKSKEIYIPLSTIYGKPNADGTYTLTALDIKNLNDNLYALAKKIQGGLTFADMTKEVNQEYSNMEGDITQVQIDANGLATRVSSAEGDISSLEQTASGLSVRVSDVESRNTVTINANGMYVTDQNGNTTQLTGNQITSGTMQGVTIISKGAAARVVINEGGIEIWDPNDDPWSTKYADIGYFNSDNKIHITSNEPIKIEGDGVSIDASGTVYIGTSYSGENVSIGNSGGSVNLVGNVTVNGTPIGG